MCVCVMCVRGVGIKTVLLDMLAPSVERAPGSEFLPCSQVSKRSAVVESARVMSCWQVLDVDASIRAVFKRGGGEGRAVLNEEKKRSVPVPRFPKNAHGHTMCWRLAVGSWWLATGG